MMRKLSEIMSQQIRRVNTDTRLSSNIKNMLLKHVKLFLMTNSMRRNIVEIRFSQCYCDNTSLIFRLLAYSFGDRREQIYSTSE